MTRRKESAEHKLRLEDAYAGELNADLKAKYGSQSNAADAVDINQSTVSRVLSGEPTTLDTLMKLWEASDIPQPPLVMSKSKRHAEWCRLGALLLEKSPDQFNHAIRNAENSARLVGIGDDEWTGELRKTTQVVDVDAVKSVIANPLRTDRKRGVRRS